MPELPEVETIVRKLRNNVLNQTIKEVEITKPKIIEYPTVDEFCKRLKNKQILDINRRGKFIIISLNDDTSLVAHMRMTGRLYVSEKDQPMEKHTHLILDLGGSLSIRFCDPRRFGRFWLVENDELEEVTGINKLGIEPLDKNLTGQYLQDHLKSRKKAIKTLLLDQDIVAGIGNIYADEILFKAGILPMRKANSLTENEFTRLAKAIPEVIAENINTCDKKNDNSLPNLLDYRTSESIRIYNHDGQPCPNCNHELVKTKINGRTTTYCPDCQS